MWVGILCFFVIFVIGLVFVTQPFWDDWKKKPKPKVETKTYDINLSDYEAMIESANISGSSSFEYTHSRKLSCFACKLFGNEYRDNLKDFNNEWLQCVKRDYSTCKHSRDLFWSEPDPDTKHVFWRKSEIGRREAAEKLKLIEQARFELK